MSDFLSHLIARNLDAGETLRPRLPSLFEPVKGGRDLLSEEPLHSTLVGAFDGPEATGLEEIETSAGALARDDRSEMPHQPRKQVEPDWIGTSPVAWIKRSEIQDPRIPFHSIQATSGVTVKQLLSNGTPHVSLPSRIAPAEEQANAVMPRIIAETRRQLTPESAKKSIAVPAADPMSTRDLNGRHARQGNEPAATRLLDSGPRRSDDVSSSIADPRPPFSVQSDQAPVQRARVSIPAVARPQVTRHVERFTQVPDAYTRGTPETVPTIQVTIGRIEVRATPAPTQHAKKLRSAPSAMTLDDYLRNRGKGEGR